MSDEAQEVTLNEDQRNALDHILRQIEGGGSASRAVRRDRQRQDRAVYPGDRAVVREARRRSSCCLKLR